MSLPPGYEQLEHHGARLVLRSDLRAPLLAAGVADPLAVIARHPADVGGRARLGRIELEGVGPLLVRALVRGGLVGKVVRRLSWDPLRAESELRVSVEAAARGASVPEVVAAVTRRVPGGYQHGLVVRELSGARDLVAVLRAEPEGIARWRALRAAGEAVRRLHDAGVDHVDLNLKNVLVGQDGRGVVIDLDRCRVHEAALDERGRERNLLRLYRSWLKLQAAEPQVTCPRDPLRVARAYAQGELDRWRRLVERGRAARFWSHQLRWALFPPRFPA
ncbi:MAG: lipopolysaccharide kinase InaA family protein [Planctomycetota bacterium]